MRTLLLLPSALLVALLGSVPILAQTADADRPAALKRLTDCRTITDASQRLACYDREVAAVDAAEARKELVIVDRDQIKKTRKTLFGLTLPNLSIFGDGGDDDEEGFSRIESRIKQVGRTPYGKWILVLEDGARWIQTDSRELPIEPKPGHEIKIRKGALSSYLANVNGQVAIQVKRIS